MSARAGARRVAAALALVAVACGGEPVPQEEPRGAGEIRVATIVDRFGPGVDITTIDARFSAPGTHAQCEQAAHGGCVVVGCVEDPARVTPDAGELSVQTTDERFLQNLRADASGVYSFGDESEVFVSGDHVAARLAGAEVPALEVRGVFPEPLVLTEPVPPSDGSALVVDRGVDLTLRWAAGVEQTVLSVSMDGPARSLRCIAPSERGVLTVPASAFAALEGGSLDVRTVRSVAARAGSYDVALVLVAAAVDSAGAGVALELEP